MNKSISGFIFKIIFMITIIFSGISIIFYDYTSDVNDIIGGNLKLSVKNTMNKSIESLNDEIDMYKNLLIQIENSIKDNINDKEEVILHINSMLLTSNISSIYHVNHLGIGYDENGKEVRVSSGVIKDDNNITIGNKLVNIKEKRYMTFSKKVSHNDYLVFLIDIDSIANRLYELAPNSTGFTTVIDNYGNLIMSKGKNANYTSLENILLNIEDEKNSISKIKSDIALNLSGELTVNIFNEDSLVSYEPVGINNWYIIMSSPLSVINSKSSQLTTVTFSLLLKIVVIIIVLWTYFYVTQRKEKQKLKLSEETHKIVVNQAECIIFEHNYITGEINHSDRYFELFNEEFIKTNFPYSYIKEGIIHEDDGNELIKYFNNTSLHNGLEVRIRNNYGEYIWCKIKMEPVYDEFNKQLKLIGSIQSINEQKQKELELIKRSMNDSLTNLYNKGATELLITNFIANYGQENKHAFIIVDLDNFKKINDTKGHMYGDEILRKVSSSLSESFTNSSIIGRIGGDEFVVFIKNIESFKNAELYGERICEVFRKHSNDGYMVSGSVGIAISPDSGQTFFELYKNADIALYEAKKQGKDRYNIYRK
ncbi:MAG: diguanylate cyclase domain-containing protein [Clostridium sp.]